MVSEIKVAKSFLGSLKVISGVVCCVLSTNIRAHVLVDVVTG